MTDSAILPAQRAALVDSSGTTTPEFYRFFRGLSSTAQLPARVDDLTVRVAKLEDGYAPGAGSVVGQQSVVSQGILANGVVSLNLQGDITIAPALSFYGALNEGGKGWQTLSENFAKRDNGDGTASLDLTDLPDTGTGALLATTFDAKGRKTGSRPATITGTAGRITVANGDASAGLPTIDLATVTDAGGGTLQRFVRDAWGRLSGTSAATTSDLAEGTNLYYTDARADARIALQKAQPNGLATLDGAGKLDAGQLPALAITETFVVNTQAAMLALAAQEGDVAVRTDLSKSFILTAAPASTLANWQELLTPASPVTSVFGRVGSVTAATGDYTPAQVGAEPAIPAGTAAQYRRGDKTWQALNKAAVGLGNVDNTSDTAKPVSTAQAAAIDAKMSKSGDTASGDYKFDTNTLVIDSVNHFLGVRASTPKQILHIVGPDGPVPSFPASAVGPRNFVILENNNNNNIAVIAGENSGAGFLYIKSGASVLSGAMQYNFNNDTMNFYSAGAPRLYIDANGNVVPNVDNAQSVGTASGRWSVYYGATGAINTSDAREKTAVSPLTTAELSATADLCRAIGTYQWLAMIAEKGADNARHHAGLTVQRAIEIMQAHGLDPMRYGFICHDQWDELPEVVNSWPAQDAVLDDAGNVITPAVEAGSEITQEYRPAGDRYSFRHDELLLFMARGFAARLDALETK